MGFGAAVSILLSLIKGNQDVLSKLTEWCSFIYQKY